MTVIMIFVSNAKISIVGAEEATPPSCRYFPKGKDDDSLPMVIELNEIALIGAGGVGPLKFIISGITILEHLWLIL